MRTNQRPLARLQHYLTKDCPTKKGDRYDTRTTLA